MNGLLIRTVIFGCTLHLLVGVAGAWAGPPTEIAQQVIEKALDALKDPTSQGEARRQKVKRIVDPYFDYQEMAKRSLGPAWGKLSAGQRQEFVQLFAQLLEASYSDKIEKYAQRVKINYTGEILEGEYAEVRTVVVRANDRIPLNYRLLQEGGAWKVYDVVIEGVSLVSNYRSQFSRIIHESGYAELVKRLKTKVSELTRAG
ncbi:MAG: organic solvent tolerance ABC transporter substrate-binding protein [Deltaproteobacteria bacterium CG07_land_8_20_14_0_80_60_11]|nr:MAG: organic solvent tolerance ABC transporter substrate-binding protein [Deltaproteobacteria bacterium CG07_land_8_20_14_0_80_60_11]